MTDTPTTAPMWQDIATAPKDGSLFLAANANLSAQNMVVIYWEHGSVAFSIIGHWRTSMHEVITEACITHWQPLPAPPTA